MKRNILLLALLITASGVFQSCRDTERETGDTEILEDEVKTNPGTMDAVDDGFGAFDTNTDDQWDENEFSEAYQSDFSGYDSDASGDLSSEEFSGATFRSTDRNQDNTISRDEWDAGRSDNFGNYAASEDFDRFDTDQSQDLSASEWNEGFRDSEWFSSTDTDRNNTVSDEEWTRANFSRWDRNGDGVLDRQEFQTYDRMMRNTGNNQNRNSQPNNEE